MLQFKKNCISYIFFFQKIGDYYRGYVDTEVELDILLTYHKQATQSFWGTRQSPSPAKQSTRFMWKSQYVPYDGIPFVNTGTLIKHKNIILSDNNAAVVMKNHLCHLSLLSVAQN